MIRPCLDEIWEKILNIEIEIYEEVSVIEKRLETLESRVNARCVADRIMQERLEVLEKKIN